MYHRLRRPCALLILAALSLPFAVVDSQAGSLETIQTKIAQYLKRPGIRSAHWGIEIVDPLTDQVLLSVNADKPFKPASVMKVLTTATALEKLGPDFTFHTGVYTSGAIRPNGTLAGDLILVGRGDPNLANPEGDLLEKPALQELAEKIQALGIRRIEGGIIADDSYFDATSHGKGWTARDLKTIYGAPISALSLNNNVFWVSVRANKPNKLVSAWVEPHTSYYVIRNRGVSGTRRSRRTINARLAPGTRTIAISGVLPANQSFSQYILLDNPSGVVGTTFRDELQRQGIRVSGRVTVNHQPFSDDARRSWTLLADHESPPLVRGLEIINKRSQNLHAEMLLRTLGAQFRGSGTDEAGLEVVKDFVVESGIDVGKINLSDGCGLSRENLVTPRFQTSLLRVLSTKPYFGLFLNTLAVSGTDGTLKHRLGSNQTRGVIHAKTGSLRGVSTLSGYMTTRSGRNLIFSIFANDANSIGRVKKTIDDICSLFVNLY